MNWIVSFLKSSIGRKIVMSLTGLFLITFLIIHLIGNMQLLISQSSFEGFTHFMEHNPVIKIAAWVLYAGFILHIVQGLLLWFSNMGSSGGKYAVSPKGQKGVGLASKNMGILGTLILAFLLIHLADFFGPLKVRGTLEEADLFNAVIAKFKNPAFVGIYVGGMIVLAFHLWHGFQSAFQTLGLNHPKYTPIIKGLGKAYAIIVPLLFALIPIYIYLSK